MFIFDTGSFISLGHYYPEQFPSFWNEFNAAVESGIVLSCREVYRELQGHGNKPHLQRWIRANRVIFYTPTATETQFIASIFAVPHFAQLVSARQRLKGSPVADPFLVAAAHVKSATVITEEEAKPNGAKMPNVCSHFGVACANLERFMQIQAWRF